MTTFSFIFLVDGMFVLKERRKDFRPSSSYQSLSRPIEDEFSNKLKINNSRALDSNRTEKQLDVADAETGVPLQLTKAKWNPREGRLSLNARIILDMGTGKLDICKSPNRKAISPSRKERSNPIVKEFLEKGPLTPNMHIGWNPRSNTIDYDILSEHEMHTVSALSSVGEDQLNEPFADNEIDDDNSIKSFPSVQKVNSYDSYNSYNSDNNSVGNETKSSGVKSANEESLLQSSQSRSLYTAFVANGVHDTSLGSSSGRRFSRARASSIYSPSQSLSALSSRSGSRANDKNYIGELSGLVPENIGESAFSNLFIPPS